MTYICYRGIEVSARLQYGLLGIEVVVLILFSIVALFKVYTHSAEDYSLMPSLSWFWPGGLDFGSIIAPAVLTTIFIYWGWDTAVACNEESDDPGTHPRPRRGDLDLPPAGHLRLGERGHRRVRRRWHRGHRARQPRQRGRRVLGDRPGPVRRQRPRSRRPVAAVGLDPDVRVGLDADDDPADRAHHAVDGRL